MWRINNATSLGGEVCAPWVVNHTYALGARVVCRIAYATVAARAFVYECTVGGISHATIEPTWPTTPGNTVADNTVTWTCRSPDDGNWDNASCILHYVLNHAAVVAGDFVYVHNAHSESTNLSAAYTIKGSATINNPIKILCVNKTDDSLSTGALVRNSSTSYSMFFTLVGYSYGVTFRSDLYILISSASADGWWILEGSGTTTLLQLTGATAYIEIAQTATYTASLYLFNGSVDFGAVGEYFNIYPGGFLLWKGGSVVAASGVTKLFDATTGAALAWRKAIIEDVDLSAVGSGVSARALVDVSDQIQHDVIFSRCKLSSAAGFTLVVGTWAKPMTGKAKFHHCSSSNITYDFYEDCYEGSIQDETTIVRTNGASDGTTPISHKMISSANTKESITGLIGVPITIWGLVGATTVTIECIYDGVTNLQDDEVVLEVDYPIDGTSGLGGFYTTKKKLLDILVDLTVSTVEWSTGAMGNPNKFKLQAAVTLGKDGPVTVRVVLMKASTTIYYDPLITFS